MLFEKREQSSIKHRRLEYLLLFRAARGHAACCSRCCLRTRSSCSLYPRVLSTKKYPTVIAVDDSFSMRAGRRLAPWRRTGPGAFISSLKPGDQAQVIALGGPSPGVDASRSRTPASFMGPSIRSSRPMAARRSVNWRGTSARLPSLLHMGIEFASGERPAKVGSCRPGLPTFVWIRVLALILHQVGKAETQLDRGNRGGAALACTIPRKFAWLQPSPVFGAPARESAPSRWF